MAARTQGVEARWSGPDGRRRFGPDACAYPVGWRAFAARITARRLDPGCAVVERIRRYGY
ncbi:MAG: hypothetical protein OWT27_10945 [Firmicutes bacterium]|nr:hypothetical protein [Bacillota bacterium]